MQYKYDLLKRLSDNKYLVLSLFQKLPATFGEHKQQI